VRRELQWRKTSTEKKNNQNIPGRTGKEKGGGKEQIEDGIVKGNETPEKHVSEKS